VLRGIPALPERGMLRFDKFPARKFSAVAIAMFFQFGHEHLRMSMLCVNPSVLPSDEN